jgi:DNA-directed RNA polymerase sigma subunit (sigma70/sigma32)
MTTFIWPTEDGWPYPDSTGETIDLSADVDADLLCLTASASHVYDDLDPLERRVIASHYGLNGEPTRSLAELHEDLGLPADQLSAILGSGLGKLRAQLI